MPRVRGVPRTHSCIKTTLKTMSTGSSRATTTQKRGSISEANQKISLHTTDVSRQPHIRNHTVHWHVAGHAADLIVFFLPSFPRNFIALSFLFSAHQMCASCIFHRQTTRTASCGRCCRGLPRLYIQCGRAFVRPLSSQ